MYKWIKAYRENRMPHAFLVTGMEGIEKKALIEKFAQFLLCVSPSDKGPCGVCHLCQWFSQGNHPDYYALGSEEPIRIEELRELQGFLEKTSHQNGYKVVVIYQADRMSIYTANALLKSLEEPAARTVFLLTAVLNQNVLSTLRSRCVPISLQVPFFKPLESDMLYKETLFWGIYPLFSQEKVLQKITSETQETLYLFYYWVAEYCRYGLTKDPGHLSAISEKSRYDSLLKILSIEHAIGFLDLLTEAIKSSNINGLNKTLLWGALIYQWQQLQARNITHDINSAH